MKKSLFLFTAFLLFAMISSANADLMKYTFSGTVTDATYQYDFADEIVNGTAGIWTHYFTDTAYGRTKGDTFTYTFLVDTELPGYYDSMGIRTEYPDMSGIVTADYFFIELDSGALIPDLTTQFAAIPELADLPAVDGDNSAYNFGVVYSFDPVITPPPGFYRQGVNFTGGKFTHRIEVANSSPSLGAWETGLDITGKEYFLFNQYIDANTSVFIKSQINSTLKLDNVEPYIPVPEASTPVMLLSGLTALLPLSFIMRRKRSKPD